MTSIENKLQGMYAGAVIGDTLGRPIEFMQSSDIRRKFPTSDDYFSYLQKHSSVSDDTILMMHSIEYFNNGNYFNNDKKIEKYTGHLGTLAKTYSQEQLRNFGFSRKMRELFLEFAEGNKPESDFTNNPGSGFVPLLIPAVQKAGSSEELSSIINFYTEQTHTAADKFWAKNYFSLLVAVLKSEPLINCVPFDSRTNIALSGNIEKIKSVTGSSDSLIPAAVALYIASNRNFNLMYELAVKNFKTADFDTLFFATGAMIGAAVGYNNLPLDYLRIVEEKFDFNKIKKYTETNLLGKSLDVRPFNLVDLVSSKELNKEIIFNLIPELAVQKDYNSNQPRHCYNLWEHTHRTVQTISQNKPYLRIAALLHDVAKPFVREEGKNCATYHNHAKTGARMSYEILSRLDFDEEKKKNIVSLIDEHVINYSDQWSDSAIRRFILRNNNLDDLFELVNADNSAQLSGDNQKLVLLKERIKNYDTLICL